MENNPHPLLVMISVIGAGYIGRICGIPFTVQMPVLLYLP